MVGNRKLGSSGLPKHRSRSYPDHSVIQRPGRGREVVVSSYLVVVFFNLSF